MFAESWTSQKLLTMYFALYVTFWKELNSKEKERKKGRKEVSHIHINVIKGTTDKKAVMLASNL